MGNPSGADPCSTVFPWMDQQDETSPTQEWSDHATHTGELRTTATKTPWAPHNLLPPLHAESAIHVSPPTPSSGAPFSLDVSRLQLKHDEATHSIFSHARIQTVRPGVAPRVQTLDADAGRGLCQNVLEGQGFDSRRPSSGNNLTDVAEFDDRGTRVPLTRHCTGFAVGE